MNIGQSLIANLLTTETRQPSQRALDHSNALAGIASREQIANAARGERIVLGLRISGLIALHASRTMTWMALFSADRRNAID